MRKSEEKMSAAKDNKEFERILICRDCGETERIFFCDCNENEMRM